jgi:hypothetical protein
VTAVAEFVDRAQDSTAKGKADVAHEVAQQAMFAAICAEQKIVMLRERIRRLERLATTDELTGVLNRRGFEAELRRTLDLARRLAKPGFSCSSTWTTSNGSTTPTDMRQETRSCDTLHRS